MGLGGASGLIWAFGRNNEGELGLGNTNDSTRPSCVSGPDSARSIASGRHHSVIVTKEGTVFACGSSLHGKLGLSANGLVNIQKLTQIKTLQRVKQVACGDYHTLCLTEEGKVFAWGGSLHKKTADATSSDKSEPRVVSTLQNVCVTQISCGDFHSIALDQYGTVYSWGGGGPSYNKG